MNWRACIHICFLLDSLGKYSVSQELLAGCGQENNGGRWPLPRLSFEKFFFHDLVTDPIKIHRGRGCLPHYQDNKGGQQTIMTDKQSSSPRLQRDLKALPMDEWSRQCPTMARLQPTALGNDRARTGTTRGGGKDRDWLTAPRFDEDFRVSLAGRRGLRRTAGKSRCVVWSSREAGGEMCNLCKLLLIGLRAIENARWMFFTGKLPLADADRENSNSHRTAMLWAASKGKRQRRGEGKTAPERTLGLQHEPLEVRLGTCPVRILVFAQTSWYERKRPCCQRFGTAWLCSRLYCKKVYDAVCQLGTRPLPESCDFQSSTAVALGLEHLQLPFRPRQIPIQIALRAIKLLVWGSGVVLLSMLSASSFHS
ncbi:hypothetical protein ACRRTK_000372 [Alexandromys fortis]